PFEPTATLGVPTDFIAGSSGGSGDGPDAPTPTIAPTTAPSATPTGTAGAEEDTGTGGVGTLRAMDPTPVMLTVLGALALLLMPALVREVRRAVRTRRARSGDAMAAWLELSDTLGDLGLPAPAAQTARVRADVLASTRGADAESLAALVAAVERTSYAPSAPRVEDLATPLRVVTGQLTAATDARQRLIARLAPASLFVRRR